MLTIYYYDFIQVFQVKEVV